MPETKTIINKKVIYQKPSKTHGNGPIPVGATGLVLIYAESPSSKKILADFSPYGMAIVPLSSVKILEDK